jgi:hypothetical protein
MLVDQIEDNLVLRHQLKELHHQPQFPNLLVIWLILMEEYYRSTIEVRTELYVMMDLVNKMLL